MDHSTTPFLRELVTLFAVSGLLVYLCHRVKLVPIVGFLLTGVLIGPFALGLVTDMELINASAEVGVILLLFTIGVEFSLDELARIRRFIVVGGLIQVVVTTALTAAAVVALGGTFRAGVYTGFLIALSSTAIVLKLLSDRGLIHTPTGRIALGVLVFQDLSVIVMVLVLPFLRPGAALEGALFVALLQALGIVAIVLVAARRAVPWLLDRVAHARNQELFLLTVVVVCFGIAWIASLGGVSLALGAFLGGLAVSGSRFREHAVGEILPLRTIFNAVFFVSVGMLLDLRVLWEHPVVIPAIALLVIGGKMVATTTAVAVLGYPIRFAAAVSLFLAQIGEFSLVLNEAGRAQGLSPAGLGEVGEQGFLAATVLLMIATPFLAQAEPRVRGWLRVREAAADGAPGEPEHRNHVVIVGYGLAGRLADQVFRRFDLETAVVDLNPITIAELEVSGREAFYGDMTRSALQEEVGIRAARLLLIAINDPEATRRIVAVARGLNRTLPIVARTPYLFEDAALLRLGADVVVTEELEGSLRVIREAMRAVEIPEEEVARQMERMRTDAIDRAIHPER